MGWGKRQKRDMRAFIQEQLDDWNLGKINWVEGPDRVMSGDREGQYKIILKFRDGTEESHFDDGKLHIYIGYGSTGGYWNRNHIRKAIAHEGREKKRAIETHEVWKTAQMQITSGRDENGAWVL